MMGRMFVGLRAIGALVLWIGTIGIDFAPGTIARATPALSLVAIACPTVTVCYASGTAGTEGTVLGTSDGGDHWTTLYSGGTNRWLGPLACSGVSVCFVSGTTSSDSDRKSTIVGTVDGGTSWTRQVRVSRYGISSLACASAGHCVAAAGTWNYQNEKFKNRTMLLDTKDAGRTWRKQVVPGRYFFALACPSTRICYAGGKGLLATVDGGTTWKKRSRRVPGWIRSIACLNARRCYAAAAYAYGRYDNPGIGEIMRTADSGRTWSLSVWRSASPRPRCRRRRSCRAARACRDGASAPNECGPRFQA